MLKHLIAASLAAVLLGGLPTAVHATQQIGWHDLTVPVDPQGDPFFGLEFEPRQALEEFLLLEGYREADGELPEKAEQRVTELRAELAEAGLDAQDLLEKERAFREKIIAQRSSVRSEWDGVDVRIPGYMLPLEFDGDQVTEFLLVPYVGACIHTPPPPANQIIHVRSNMSFMAMGLFTPVWVSGELSVERSRQSVGLSDGTSGFDVGYSLRADEIIKYSE